MRLLIPMFFQGILLITLRVCLCKSTVKSTDSLNTGIYLFNQIHTDNKLISWYFILQPSIKYDPYFHKNCFKSLGVPVALR